MRIAHTQCITSIHIESYEFIYNQASLLVGNKMPLCRQNLDTDHLSVPPVSVTNFSASLHRANPSLVCLQAMPFDSLCYVT